MRFEITNAKKFPEGGNRTWGYVVEFRIDTSDFHLLTVYPGNHGLTTFFYLLFHYVACT